MSQLGDYIDNHPDSAKRLVGLDYSQLIELISHAERLHEDKKRPEKIKKLELSKQVGGDGQS